jgi:hypothetical protein
MMMDKMQKFCKAAPVVMPQGILSKRTDGI